MRRHLSRLAEALMDKVARRIADQVVDPVTYRVALEMLRAGGMPGRTPNDVFAGISDDFWFWLWTEGRRKNDSLRAFLPGIPDENVQLMFTGHKGDAVLREGFFAYKVFKEAYERHIGALEDCKAILDFGCGWGRIIRFFMKDIEASKLSGCDPVQEMVDLCRRQNKWCNFEKTNLHPPTSFGEGSFELIYGYSVFSHLSEQMHEAWLLELCRILTPGGLLLLTTRNRGFIAECANLRKRQDLTSLHAGPRSSASAFIDTEQALADYDSGKYCFSQLVHDGEWSYWGEAAISKAYVQKHWNQHLILVDYVEDQKRCDQNVIIMRKPGREALSSKSHRADAFATS